MNKIIKVVTGLTVALMLMVPVIASASTDPFGKNFVSENTDLGNKAPQEIAANVINIALTFLGIIAVVMILIGGFKWMTAGGNEDQVDEAKKIITAAVIGLVVILAAWGIANFVIDSAVNVTGVK